MPTFRSVRLLAIYEALKADRTKWYGEIKAMFPKSLRIGIGTVRRVSRDHLNERITNDRARRRFYAVQSHFTYWRYLKNPSQRKPHKPSWIEYHLRLELRKGGYFQCSYCRRVFPLSVAPKGCSKSTCSDCRNVYKRPFRRIWARKKRQMDEWTEN